MKTIKISEATEIQIDYLVAKVEGMLPRPVWGRGSIQFKSGFWTPPRPTGGRQPYVLRHEFERIQKQAEGPVLDSFTKIWEPSADWAQGGPIIEREKISVQVTFCDGKFYSWQAAGHDLQYDEVGDFIEGSDHACDGPTMLIAAMRCYVASKLGDEAEVPEELT